MDRQTAWRRLKLLESHGIIKMVKIGNENKSTRWRYMAPMDDEQGDSKGKGASDAA